MEPSKKTAEQIGIETRTCETHGPYEVRVQEFRGTMFRVGECAHCKEIREAEDRAREEQAKQLRLEQALGRAGIPQRLFNRSFDTFNAETPAQIRALTAARDFAEQFSDHRKRGTTLVLSGKTGTGKGHLAASIAHSVLRSGKTVFFATARELILMLRASWQDKSAPSELEVLRRLAGLDLLVIDEIGVQSGTDAERDQIFSVIDGRYRDQLPMILTTNLTRAELPGVIGDRAFSRLREDGIWIAFDWDDWRGRRAA